MTPPEQDELADEVRRRAAGDSELEHLAAAVDLSDELSQRADAIVGHFVDAARVAGCSWAQIGGVLGVTRQAAQQQDSSRRKRPGGWRWSRPAAGPFDRYSDRMRRVLVLTAGEAERLRHNWIGTEHILLGLLDEGEGVAARALRDLGVGADAIRARVEKLVGTGPAESGTPAENGTPADDSRPFTARAKDALDFGIKEARKLGHNDVGPEHALLGLLAEGKGLAAQVLVDLGVDLPGLRRRVIDLVSDLDQTSKVPPARQ